MPPPPPVCIKFHIQPSSLLLPFSRMSPSSFSTPPLPLQVIIAQSLMLRSRYCVRLLQHCFFFRCFYFFNVKIILMIRTVLSENNKTSLPLVKNQSTLFSIVQSIITMAVPRYQPHTWRGRREPALLYETQHHSILNRLRLSAKHVAGKAITWSTNNENDENKRARIRKCLDRIL